MKFDDLLKQTSEWLKGTGPRSEIVISSRTRLARNVDNIPFYHWANSKQKIEVLERVKNAIAKSKYLKGALFLEMEGLSDLDRQILLERHLISREHAEVKDKDYKAVVIDEREIVSVMINEEDHLRIQVIQSGFNLVEAWRVVEKIEAELNEDLEFAYSSSLGYLTACPTNVGTGLRASCMLHLPALVMTKQIGKILHAISKLNMTIRGFYGEGTEATGNFFQVSNQATLGRGETDTIDNLERIINQIVTREEAARQRLLERDKEIVNDRIWRAHATLSAARIITSKETLELLSAIRLGVDIGLLRDIDRGSLNELFIIIQPAHLQKSEGRLLSPQERDVTRAEIIRKKLGKETL